MKLARVNKPTKGSADKQVEFNDMICYADYPSEEHLKKSIEHKSKEWAHHAFEYKFGASGNFTRFQRRYEAFCCGYLFYYDYQLRSQQIDHTIHFRWEKGKAKDCYEVFIYLNPAPVKEKKNPITPKRSIPQLVEGKKILSNGKMVLAAEYPSGPDQQDLLIDPPPPPPPPPPSMHE